MSNASERTREVFERAMAALERIDAHIDEAAEKLRELQPKKPGAILLERHDCGAGCLGCPHPRWKVWRSDQRKKPARWYASTLKTNPTQSVKKTGPFEANQALVRYYIAEIQEAMKARAALTAAIASVGKVMRQRKLG